MHRKAIRAALATGFLVNPSVSSKDQEADIPWINEYALKQGELWKSAREAGENKSMLSIAH